MVLFLAFVSLVARFESNLDLPGSFLTSVSGILGLAIGSGTCRPASTMSSSRGSSMTKRPG